MTLTGKYYYAPGGVITAPLPYRSFAGPHDLPTAWKNVSGFHHQDDAALATHDWFPQDRVGYEPFDPATQVRSGPVQDVQADKVVDTYTVSAKPTPTDNELATGTAVSAVQFYSALHAAMAAKGHAMVTSTPTRWQLVDIYNALPSAVLPDASKLVITNVLVDANEFHRDDPNPTTGTGNALNDIGALLAYVGGDPASPDPAMAFTAAEIDTIFADIIRAGG